MANDSARPDYLVLVNKKHRIDPHYIDSVELVEVSGYDGEVFRVEKQAAAQFRQLQSAAKEIGLEIMLTSGYRSIERQEEIRKEFTEEYGEEYASKYVADPGTSEHHTGLALDFVAKLGGEWVIENSEIKERIEELRPIFRLLPEYGFILRYLPGKEEITGFPAEPWHIRYVGDSVVAGEILAKGITLEEYLGEI